MRVILFGVLVLFTSSCRLDEKTLFGNWQAVALFENGQSSTVDLTPVQLSFGPDGQYDFKSTGLYQEMGRYRISMHYLFMTDTSHQPPIEHIVKVLYLSSDSLKIRMEKDSTEQILWLARIPAEHPDAPGSGDQ